MKESFGKARTTNLTISEVIDSINGIAQAISSEFNSVCASHQEALQLWRLFNDGHSDRLAIIELEYMMVKLSMLIASFAEDHLKTVLQLKELETSLVTDSLDEGPRQLVTVESNRVVATYRRYQSTFTQLRLGFEKISGYFCYPSRD